jgi:cobalt/nickel transport protein
MKASIAMLAFFYFPDWIGRLVVSLQAFGGGRCMVRNRLFLALAVLALVGAAPAAWAHFGTITPSDDIITQEDSKTISIDVKFIHPMEMHYMEMEKPKRFGVLYKGKAEDLLATLQATKGKSADQDKTFSFWKASYTIKKPGDYCFFEEPTPYWEPAEDKFIVHYAKVCVNALGLEGGWDKPVGLETEIIPLTRPYGLWTGNVFTGVVLVKGKPVPNAEVEIEYLNESPENKSPLKAPSDPFVTQVVKADKNGVFTYAMPKAGWWGFAALQDASWKLKKDGKPKDVEIGAVLWVRTTDMK